MADHVLTDSALTKALAQHLHDHGVGEYQPDGNPFTEGVVGIFYGAIGTAPDRGIGIRVYATTDPLVDAATRRVQIRTRGLPRQPDGADVLADAIFHVLHGSTQVVGVSQVVRAYAAPLGADTSHRQERADTYTIILDNPEVLP